MGETFLPKYLILAARHRARERGFESVSDYLGNLVAQDLGLKPAKAPARRSAARGSEIRQRHETVSLIRKRLLDGMFSYMKMSEDPGFGYACGYTLKHIDRCAAITRDFLGRLASLPKGQTAKIIAEVKHVVVKLNRLNASCDGALIETDQREDLCLLIQTAAEKAGLRSDQDVTAEWREW